ncbi:MAG: hypothetical protein C7B47_01355 [Sulfobacillus thermosulfidooxidans]|uniref:NFACT RNA-binding domain-containing protein n=1 Tax=Sulfobacillus thermosulfidooxidans TaxID=28034 RepID=A0A2T2X684_SULTH|nr:MAG: hypothetical protein C7B47_01355 [Sulfobacillus thermosulfidooxidans]
MPFDAFLLERLAHHWNTRWQDVELSAAWADKTHVIFQGWHKDAHEKVFILLAFTPGLARIHETHHRFELPKATHPLFTRFLPLTVDAVFTPAFDRILWLKVHWTDDWGQPSYGYLVIELTGHITNLIILDAEYKILEALRHFQDKNHQRVIRPGQRYQAPPPLPNACQTHQLSDVSPLIRKLVPEPGQWPLEAFCRQYTTSTLPFVLLHHDVLKDLWVFPLPGWQSELVENPDEILDNLFFEKEQERLRINLQQQLVAYWKDRVQHLRTKLAETEESQQEDVEKWKDEGDLWLAYQYQFKNHHELTIPSFADPSRLVTLVLPEDKTPAEMAEQCYRLYKKAKSRVAASSRLAEILREELTHAEQSLNLAQQNHPISYYRDQLKQVASPARSKQLENQPFRRFVSTGGFDIFVGRNREENQELTMRRARPDDLWFHVKQAPGSHVVLFSGKRQPNLEDLLDAAHLAAYYSPAKHSSTVAVDYTKRKFVRKRPHADMGQVLYEREKTLYVTPDPERLRRLGATHDKLID